HRLHDRGLHQRSPHPGEIPLRRTHGRRGRKTGGGGGAERRRVAAGGGGGDVGIVGLIREGGRRQIPTRRWKLYGDDVLVVEADPQTLEQFARDGNLELVGSEK